MHRKPLAAALLLPLIVGCGGGSDDKDEVQSRDDTGEPPMEALFSFAVFADPHLTEDTLENQGRLSAAVEWVNTQPNIELTVVVGDIGWNGGLPIAKAMLDGLNAPYLPILGDNEVHIGAEETFDDVFTEQYDLLATTMDHFERGPIEVQNPEWGQTSWFQNMRFGYRGLEFIGLDWCSRDDDFLLGEMATLHDFEGGTFPWFIDELGSIEAGPDENVLLFSHHPMYGSLGAFNNADAGDLAGLTRPLEDRVAAAWSGHWHINTDLAITDGGYSVHVTDGMWDDENTVRVVHISGNGERFIYDQELVIVPP